MRTLKPTTNKLDNIDFYVFDTETWGLNPQPKYLAFGVIYGKDTYKVFYNRQEFEIELKKKKYRNKKFFAHNIEYDLSAIFGNIFQNVDNEAIFNGSRFIMAKYKYNNIKFYDSFNIIPFALEKIGNELNFPKLITPKKFFSKHNKGKEINENDIIYCKRDCEVTYKALYNFFNITGKIKMTIGSEAMIYFRANFLDKGIRYTEKTQLYFNSYYGGRTEVFRQGKCNAKSIDINSLYPSVMQKMKFPDPSNIKKINVSVKDFPEILQKYEGVAKVKINHKDNYFGFLPLKIDHKLLFPVGIFSGYWNFNELRYAYNHGIITFLQIYEVYISPRINTSFDKYVSELYFNRTNAPTNFQSMVWKLMLNNLYGKFGMRKKYSKIYYKYPPFKLINQMDKKGIKYEIISLGKNREDIFIQKENKKLEYSYTAIPSYASYVTSEARITILDNLLKRSDNFKVLYCDTDSIFYEGKIPDTIKIGKNLGEFKIEDKVITEIFSPKNYTVNEKRKIKGVPAKAEFIGYDKNGFEVWQFQKYAKTMSGLKNIANHKTGENFIETKIINNKYTKREILENGETKPLKIYEDENNYIFW